MNKTASIVWAICLIAGLVIWEIAAVTTPSVAFFVGSPLSILGALRDMFVSERFYFHLGVTALEAGSGLLVGTMLGSVGGLLAWYFRRGAELPIMLLSAIGSIPILAFAPLMIVWFGVGIGMKVVLASIATFFVAFSQSLHGAHRVAGEHIDFVLAMQGTDTQVFLKVVMPGSLGWVLGSMRLNASVCLLGAFVGEFIASDIGLGYLILRASSLYNMPRALAAGVGIAFLALVFDAFGKKLEREREWVAQILSVPQPLWKPLGRKK